MSEVSDASGSGISLPSDFSAMLDKVLSNPEILTTVASALSGASETAEDSAPQKVKAEAEKTAEASSGAVDVDAMMQKLPQMMKMLSPVLSSDSVKSKASAHPSDKRSCLLAAIKPYLSPARCEAIDYIIKFSQLSEILKTIN